MKPEPRWAWALVSLALAVAFSAQAAASFGHHDGFTGAISLQIAMLSALNLGLMRHQ